MAGLEGRISAHIGAVHVSAQVPDDTQLIGYRFQLYVIYRI
jgi:hypothetical protein